MVSQRGIEANPKKVRAIIDMTSSRNVKEVQRLIGQVATINRFVSKATNKCLPFFKTLKQAFQWTEECEVAFKSLGVFGALMSKFSNNIAFAIPNANALIR